MHHRGQMFHYADKSTFWLYEKALLYVLRRLIPTIVLQQSSCHLSLRMSGHHVIYMISEEEL